MKKQTSIHPAEQDSKIRIQFVGAVKAGFPSPASDFLRETIDLNKYVTAHPDATYYARVDGSSMSNEFEDGDLLVIDRSIPYADGRVVVCFVDGEFTVKRVKIQKDKCLLIPTNTDFPVLEIKEGQELQIWGVVSHVIKKL
ncbi:Protein UmuD [bioreactor metagenome]|jgi:DNA polymerase V|uniref:Protein UmuD n=1 Tax=bioreactor metagenome TaxID=1076179 RepID=A0A644WGS1_9ZZZZ|nr:translesion error-prone DNA polymerase V autoproteolytic subunit [Paludibacter sp.]MEA4985888.1 translesion error-prone DNA polymerase V autoproteolytic subunit [Paludibacter sp.]